MMAKLPRPYIPLSVKIEVAVRQLRIEHRVDDETIRRTERRGGEYLDRLLFMLRLKLGLSRDAKLELHHRPALTNRQQIKNAIGNVVGFVPDANDPEHLVWLHEADHDVETRIRGLRGQHSDLALRRIRKRRERKAKAKKRPSRWPRGRKIARRVKR